MWRPTSLVYLLPILAWEARKYQVSPHFTVSHVHVETHFTGDVYVPTSHLSLGSKDVPIYKDTEVQILIASKASLMLMSFEIRGLYSAEI